MPNDNESGNGGPAGSPEGSIFTIDIEDELRRSYLGYAVSTLIARALPESRDGLKPVQRRIIYAMRELGLTPASRHDKSAAIVGETMKRFYPHGEAALYDTMVRMAQDFSLRYPLVDGQGNFGSVDGDPPAAMRYTEARLTPLAMEMLEDIDRDTVNWMPNYKQDEDEPTVLPSKFPNFLCNGGEGIAVGMSTKVPPHNLREIVDGLVFLLDHPDAAVSDLMKFITGPDFPTAGLILGTRGIREAYETGRGRIVMQANVNIEPIENGKHAIIITELPYQVNKSELIAKIAELVKHKRVDGITAVDDFSDRHGMRVVVELRRDVQPKRVLNFLLKHTQLRHTFGVIMLALVDNQPKLLNLLDALSLFLTHRREVVVRRTRYELGRARERAHIVEGLQIALNFLDEVIQTIRTAPDSATARVSLMTRFGLTQIQAEAILSMQLRQLTQLEQEKIGDEYRGLLKSVANLEDILMNPERVIRIIKDEMRSLRDKYGDDRRTRIVLREAEEIGEEDIIPEEDTVVTISRTGYVKRMAKDTFRTQGRGGRGKTGANTREDDTIADLFVASTHHTILFFTNRGRVYKLKAYEIPLASRTAMGTAIVNLIGIEPGDIITASVPVPNISGEGYLLLATMFGEVKRVDLHEFANLRANGLICFDLEEGDELKWAQLTDGGAEAILVSEGGKSIRFKESDVPVRGRPAGGVRGMELRGPDGKLADRVVAMVLARPGAEMLVVGQRGMGKRTDLDNYRSQSRGGKGIITMKITERTGNIVGAVVVDRDETIMLMTDKGMVIRVAVAQIRSTGRSASGVQIIRLEAGHSVSAIARMAPTVDVEE